MSVRERIIEALKKNIDPDKIVLFGSKVHNPNNASDFDLFVLKKNIKHKRKLAQQIYKILYPMKEAFDVIVDTPEHYEEFKAEKSYIYYEIANKGEVIYEKK
jgi:uncharacterized protein